MGDSHDGRLINVSSDAHLVYGPSAGVPTVCLLRGGESNYNALTFLEGREWFKKIYNGSSIFDVCNIQRIYW